MESQKSRVFALLGSLNISNPTMTVPINDEDKNNNRLVWKFIQPKGMLTLDLLDPDAIIMWAGDDGNTFIHTLHNDDEIELFLIKYFIHQNFGNGWID